MIGSLITRILVMVFGYAFPAYECYKTVEKNKPEIEQLRFWCQYWILVAVLTVFERFGDAFISWVPMYSEAKLALFVYLWYPKTQGTKYVYDSFFRPYIARHETEIDRNLSELRTRAGDMLVLYWQKAASYGQTRIFDVLQFIAAQSTPKTRPTGPVSSRGENPAPTRQVSISDKQPPPVARQASNSSTSDRQVLPPGPMRQPSTPTRSRSVSMADAESPSSSSSSSSGSIDMEDDTVSLEVIQPPSPPVDSSIEPQPKVLQPSASDADTASKADVSSIDGERPLTRAGLRSRALGVRK